VKVYLFLSILIIIFAWNIGGNRNNIESTDTDRHTEVQNEIIYKDMYGHDFVMSKHDGYVLIEYLNGDNTIIWSICADRDNLFKEDDMTSIVSSSNAPWADEGVIISGNPYCISIVRKDVDIVEFWSSVKLKDTKMIHNGKWMSRSELINSLRDKE
jgi:hypothetical protein